MSIKDINDKMSHIEEMLKKKTEKDVSISDIANSLEEIVRTMLDSGMLSGDTAEEVQRMCIKRFVKNEMDAATAEILEKTQKRYPRFEGKLKIAIQVTEMDEDEE